MDKHWDSKVEHFLQDDLRILKLYYFRGNRNTLHTERTFSSDARQSTEPQIISETVLSFVRKICFHYHKECPGFFA